MGVAEMRIIRTTEAPAGCRTRATPASRLRNTMTRRLLCREKYAQGDNTMDLTIWQFGTLYPRSGFYAHRGQLPARESTGAVRLWARKPRHGRVAANGIVPLPPDVGLLRAARDILGNAKRTFRSCSPAGYLDGYASARAARKYKCASCVILSFASGGCRAVALALTGDKLGVDPSNVCSGSGRGYHKKIEACCAISHRLYRAMSDGRKDAIHPFARFSLSNCCGQTVFQPPYVASFLLSDLTCVSFRSACWRCTRSLAKFFLTSRQSGSGRKEKVKSKRQRG